MRWFRSVPMADRMEILRDVTDLIQAASPAFAKLPPTRKTA